MSIRNEVRKSKVFGEFTKEDQEYWFTQTDHKALHHIDTLYYSVKILEERVIDGEFEAPEILKLISALEEVKQYKLEHIQDPVEFHGLTYELKSFSIYNFCLSENELYDIFIAKSVMTEDTPRIVVQLRTLSLVQNGVLESIYRSFEKVNSILTEFGIKVLELNENRIDYAWHTSMIQNVQAFMCDEYLKVHLKSNMRNAVKHFNPSTFEYNYLAIGNRRSNNIFFRCYDKTKEVVEEAYKGFFFDRWYENGLISRYDYYCLNRAYELRSYAVGLLVGRIEWYLEFGNDERRKSFLRSVLEKYDINSSNSKYIRNVLDGKLRRISCDDFVRSCGSQVYSEMISCSPDREAAFDVLCDDGEISGEDRCTLDKLLPPVTTILNFEYQTKRHFYRTLDAMLAGMSYSPTNVIYDRIEKILACEAAICDYLTSYNATCCFVRDRKAKCDPELLRKDPGQVYTDFWHRIRSVKIDQCGDIEFFRRYAHRPDIKRLQTRILNCMASLSYMLIGNVDEVRSFQEDASDVLCTLNDNDTKEGIEFHSSSTDDLLELKNERYPDIRKRKRRMMKNVVKDAFDE